MLLNDCGRSVEVKAKLFRGFAEPSRLGILEALRDGPRTVSQVVSMTGLTQPNASNHLACLLDCGLVARERLGRFALYRLADERVGSLLQLVDEVLSEVARGAYVCPRYALPAAVDPSIAPGLGA